MRGVVTGGWPFVVAAYTITSLALLVYGVSLITRVREMWSHGNEERKAE